VTPAVSIPLETPGVETTDQHKLTPDKSSLLEVTPPVTPALEAIGEEVARRKRPTVEGENILTAVKSIPVDVTPDVLTPVETPLYAIPFGATPTQNRRLFRCTLAQHGHTDAEEAIYQLFWRLGKTGRAGKQEPSGSYLCWPPQNLLIRESHKSESTVRRLIRSLVEKLAIDVVQEATKTEPRVYRVFTQKQILERRRAAGLNHARNTGAMSLS